MKDIILKYLKRTGKISEFKLFLDIFKELPSSQLALIKISGQTLTNHLEQFTDDIAFLSNLSLFPIIVHGAGDRLDKELAYTKKLNQIRITPKEDIARIKEIILEISNLLKRKIEFYGGKAKVLDSCIIADFLDFNKYGFVGSIKSINKNKIEKVIKKGYIPIIPPLGITNTGKILNINADTVANALAEELMVKKQIFVTETGGILDENGFIIPFINLSTVKSLDFIKEGMLLKIREIKKFLCKNSKIDVTITSSAMLLQELFTISGCGTVIKNHIIKSKKRLENFDVKKITNLLENAFSKKLIKSYFKEPITEIFYQEDYEAIAIIKKIGPTFYLCKFAVSKVRQGTGLGKALWQVVLLKYDNLIWRSDKKNIINPFYLNNSDGVIKQGKWYIYWKNIDNKLLIDTLDKVAKKDETLIKVK